eukprot:8992-Heterococcus_DN1.PRE.2
MSAGSGCRSLQNHSILLCEPDAAIPRASATMSKTMLSLCASFNVATSASDPARKLSLWSVLCSCSSVSSASLRREGDAKTAS